MIDFTVIKKEFQIRYNAVLDMSISNLLMPEANADVFVELEDALVAIKLMDETVSRQAIEDFLFACEFESFCPLFLFRHPNSSPLAIICSYLNTAAYSIDENLDITPFIVDADGVKIATELFSINDFEYRHIYFFNVGRQVLGFSIPQRPFRMMFLNKQLDYHDFKKKEWETNKIYDESELENLFLSNDYEELFGKLYPVIRYGLNKALECRLCDEDMVQDVAEIIWRKIQRQEIQKSAHIGAFTITVCRYYILNMIRKNKGRKRIDETLAVLWEIYG